jgi:hypothetical protein
MQVNSNPFPQRSLSTRAGAPNSSQHGNPFDVDMLPDPLVYYRAELKLFKERGDWAKALCPFHNDRNPSFAVHLPSGGFHCFACRIRGRSIVTYRMKRYGETFREAAIALGAWRSA